MLYYFLVVVLRCLRGAWPVEFHAWAPLFLYDYKERVCIAKTFFTYEQQLHKLQLEKNLIIPDITAAKLTLEKLSYYSLIEGYKQLFKHSPSRYRILEYKQLYINQKESFPNQPFGTFHAKSNRPTKPIHLYFSSC